MNKDEKQLKSYEKLTNDIYLLIKKEERQRLTSEDRTLIKELKSKVRSLFYEITDNDALKSLVKEQREILEELEKNIPINYENCYHLNIKWNREKGENICCADCQTSNDNSTKFLNKICIYHWMNISNWLIANKIKITQENVGKNTYNLYRKLNRAKQFSTVNDIQQAYLTIEKELNQIAEQKGLVSPWKQYYSNNNTSNTHTDRQTDRERERESKFTERYY